MTICQSSSSHPNLPFELEREIFQIAALAFPKSLPTILLVAHRFEPELYRVIRLDDRRVVPPLYTDGLIRGSLDIARLQYFGPWVHHILLQYRPVDEIAQVLTACPNVHDLALWIVRGNGASLVPILARLPLRRLSFDIRPLFYSITEALDGVVPLGQAPFDALTHLEVINVSGGWNLWHELALLPRLTHLAIEGSRIEDGVEVMERALTECAALEVLVLRYADDLAHTPDDLQIAERQKDPRFVVVSYSDHSVGCLLDEWEVGARSGEDFWVTAERVKSARLRGCRSGA